MEIEKYGALKITQSGNEILYKNLEFSKREMDIISPAKKKIAKEKTQLEQNLYDDLESKVIFDELKNYRTDKSKEKKVPPYVIFQDKTIIELSNSKPTLLSNLHKINGLGTTRIEQYGEDIIKIITENSSSENQNLFQTNTHTEDEYENHELQWSAKNDLELEYLYLEKSLTINKLSKKFNSNDTVIRARLKRLDLM